MHIAESKIRKSHLSTLMENVKLAKQYVQKGQLPSDVFEKLAKSDPTPTKKYVGYMAKAWIAGSKDVEELINYIAQYNNYLQKGKVETKDIYQYKSFNDLKAEVDELNLTGAGKSTKDLEADTETIVDNDDILVMSPYTHAASRKLGLSIFAFRDCEGGGKDSAWCTTFKSPDHFDSYFGRGVTFYYVKIKSKEMIKALQQAFPSRYKSLLVCAIAVLPDGQMDAYDGLDKQLSTSDTEKFTKIVGLA